MDYKTQSKHAIILKQVVAQLKCSINGHFTRSSRLTGSTGCSAGLNSMPISMPCGIPPWAATEADCWCPCCTCLFTKSIKHDCTCQFEESEMERSAAQIQPRRSWQGNEERCKMRWGGLWEKDTLDMLRSEAGQQRVRRGLAPRRMWFDGSGPVSAAESPGR